ncbi:MAG: SoxR reducing system RseC family protein [Candidatus Cloacimonadaceae bacterium]
MSAEQETDVGTVIAIDGRQIVVEICKSGGCKSCGLKGLCGSGKTSLLLNFETDDKYQIGDKVLVSVTAGVRVLSSLLVFVFPILALFGFFLIGRMFLHELGAILFGFGGMAIAFLIVKLLDKLIAKKINFELGGKCEDLSE